MRELLADQLDWYWTAMFRPRLVGLTDEEYFWEPADGCWNVRQGDNGRWQADFAQPTPEPPPFTTIAWRMVHIASVLGNRASWHFGDRSWNDADVAPASADDAIALCETAYGMWKSGIDDMDEAKLDEQSEGPPNSADVHFPFAAVIQHVNREVIHHGAEVAVLRDLWRATRPQSPLVAAALSGDLAALEAMGGDEVAEAKAQSPGLLVTAFERPVPRPVFERLVAMGFDPNFIVAQRTVLHSAAGAGDTEAVKLLIEAGADRTIRDSLYSATPAEWADFFEKPETAAYLRSLDP